MNKTLALVFVATFAIIVAVEANQQHQRLFRPSPWIPLNIPIPRPVAPAPAVPPTGTQPAACPAGASGCTTCGTTDATKCSATDGVLGTCLATGTACPAGCTGTPCPPACAAGCTP